MNMNNALWLIVVVAGALLFSFSIISRWLTAWSADRTVCQLFRGIGKGKRAEPISFKNEIGFAQTGFLVRSLETPRDQTNLIAWPRIQRVTAFKRDLITTDCICLLFALDDETGIELDEDMKGWAELLEAIPNLLPGCKPLSEWIFDVSSPAFATNPTIIYAKTE